MLRQKLKDAPCSAVLYEVIPPPQETTPDAVAACIESIGLLLKDRPVDAINIPEIRDEARPGSRQVQYVAKIEPRRYGALLREKLGKNTEIIVNRGIVYEPWPCQQQWLLETVNDFNLRTIVLVGGETSQRQYPGPAVTEAAQRIRQELNATSKADLLCGGITIPSRRRSEPTRDEPRRLIDKSLSGIEFFTSQVLYEAESTKKLLKDYHDLCQQQGVKPKCIFLSFAPVSSERDLAFLKWLGVQVPPDVERYILNGWIGTALRSVQVSQRILREILDYVEAQGVEVPLGLNVEHVVRHNFEVSRDMIDALYKDYSAFIAARKGVRA